MYMYTDNIIIIIGCAIHFNTCHFTPTCLILQENPDIQCDLLDDMCKVTPDKTERVDFYNKTLAYAETIVQSTVKFAKSIPGF